MIQALVRLYLRWRPHITPPIVAPVLDSPVRRLYRQPEHTLAPLQLQENLTVLEIGGGTGAFTLTTAQAVKPHGRLITIELQRAMLKHLTRRLRQTQTTNVLATQAHAAALPLPSASVDRVFIIAVLPMVPNKQQVLGEVRRVLKPGGLLLVSEEVIAPEYVPPRVTIRWAVQSGFVVVEQRRGFWCYSIVFRQS